MAAPITRLPAPAERAPTRARRPGAVLLLALIALTGLAGCGETPEAARELAGAAQGHVYEADQAAGDQARYDQLVQARRRLLQVIERYPDSPLARDIADGDRIDVAAEDWRPAIRLPEIEARLDRLRGRLAGETAADLIAAARQVPALFGEAAYPRRDLTGDLYAAGGFPRDWEQNEAGVFTPLGLEVEIRGEGNRFSLRLDRVSPSDCRAVTESFVATTPTGAAAAFVAAQLESLRIGAGRFTPPLRAAALTQACEALNSSAATLLWRFS